MLKANHRQQEDFRLDDVRRARPQGAVARETSTTSSSCSPGFLSLIGGGIVNVNIQMASLKERIREVGVKMAIGAPGREVFKEFMTEALLLTGVGLDRRASSSASASRRSSRPRSASPSTSTRRASCRRTCSPSSSASCSRSIPACKAAACRRWRRCAMSESALCRSAAAAVTRRAPRQPVRRRAARPRLGDRQRRPGRALGAQAALDADAHAPDARRLRAGRHDLGPGRRHGQDRHRLLGHELGRHDHARAEVARDDRGRRSASR